MSCELLPLLHQSYWATKRPISTPCFQTSFGCLYGPSVCLCFVHFSFSYFRNPLGIRLKVDWISIFYFFKKTEKKKKLHCYHSQGVKIEFQFIHLFIRFWTHNLPLHYITSKFFSVSSCGGVSIFATFINSFFSLFLHYFGVFFFFWVLLSFHSYNINLYWLMV